ncbi:MAG: ATP-binding protein [Bacteroidales bacterium]|nr:ATP-binding protein [Bacteroidales bacterium]
MESNKITAIRIGNIWNKYNLAWTNVQPDVNIVIGINGSGKTTIFKIIDAVMRADVKALKAFGVNVTIEMNGHTPILYTPKTTLHELKRQVEGVNYCKISTFDVPLRDRSKNSKDYSQLYSELYSLVYDIAGEESSLSDYRLMATNYPEMAQHINERIQEFFKLVDSLFEGTGKTISINRKNNRLIFTDDGEIIELHQLSSGEKQLLLVLLKVFLMDEAPYILLMDEPEISLHIEWQHRLFDVIRKLNPNTQIITSTHSPSIFGDGWGDKLIFVADMFSIKE